MQKQTKGRKNGPKSLFNKNIYFYSSTFIAFVLYKEEQKELYVTFRQNGRQFKYENIDRTTIRQALTAQNRAAEVSKLIKQASAPEFVQSYSSEQLQQMLIPKKQYNWLAK